MTNFLRMHSKGKRLILRRDTFWIN